MKTTYLVEGEIPEGFYVYALCYPNGQPFYVGKGMADRYSSHFEEYRLSSDPNKHKVRTITKIVSQGGIPLVRFLKAVKTENEAFAAEIEFIKQYGRRDTGTGILTNLTNGGEGAIGRQYTEDQLKERSDRMRGDNNPMFGKSHSQQTRGVIRQKNKDWIAAHGPRKHSDEHKQKLRENNPGGRSTARPVWQICSLSGKILNTFPSLKTAGELLNMKSWRNISTTINHHPDRVVYGCYWRWVGSPDVVEGILLDVEQKNKKRSNPVKNVRPIVQLSLDGGVIAKWESVSSAASANDMKISNLWEKVNTETPYRGFLWKYL